MPSSKANFVVRQMDPHLFATELCCESKDKEVHWLKSIIDKEDEKNRRYDRTLWNTRIYWVEKKPSIVVAIG